MSYLNKHNFIDNKYTKLYFRIITNAVNKKRIKRRTTHHDYIYFEKHHILPSSIFPTFSDIPKNSWNSVILTAREHFICHYLLCKMIEKNTPDWNSMIRAFTIMYSKSRNQHRYFNSKLYNLARKNIGYIMSVAQKGEKNSQFGTIWISHLEKEICFKIDKHDLNHYLTLGFVQKRIINWDKFNKERCKKRQKTEHKLIVIKEKIELLLDQQQELISFLTNI